MNQPRIFPTALTLAFTLACFAQEKPAEQTYKNLQVTFAALRETALSSLR